MPILVQVYFYQDLAQKGVQDLLHDLSYIFPLSSDKVENAHAGVRRVANKKTYARKVTDHTAEELSFLRVLKVEHERVKV